MSSPNQASKKVFKANHLLRTQRIPPGTRFVQLSRRDKIPICCKLPETEPLQNWCILNVETEKFSVKCPDSRTALKIELLKKLVLLANKESQNVVVPVNQNGEVFKVLAVPGLKTHVLVGPFESVYYRDSGHESTPSPMSRYVIFTTILHFTGWVQKNGSPIVLE